MGFWFFFVFRFVSLAVFRVALVSRSGVVVAVAVVAVVVAAADVGSANGLATG